MRELGNGHGSLRFLPPTSGSALPRPVNAARTISAPSTCGPDTAQNTTLPAVPCAPARTASLSAALRRESCGGLPGRPCPCSVSPVRGLLLSLTGGDLDDVLHCSVRRPGRGAGPAARCRSQVSPRAWPSHGTSSPSPRCCGLARRPPALRVSPAPAGESRSWALRPRSSHREAPSGPCSSAPALTAQWRLKKADAHAHTSLVRTPANSACCSPGTPAALQVPGRPLLNRSQESGT